MKSTSILLTISFLYGCLAYFSEFVGLLFLAYYAVVMPFLVRFSLNKNYIVTIAAAVFTINSYLLCMKVHDIIYGRQIATGYTLEHFLLLTCGAFFIIYFLSLGLVEFIRYTVLKQLAVNKGSSSSMI